MIKVSIPAHLRTLAQVNGDIELDVKGDVTLASVLDTLEETYPALAGTIRHRQNKKRRDLVRFFACAEDITHDPVDRPLPEPVAKGEETLLIVGAIAGG